MTMDIITEPRRALARQAAAMLDPPMRRAWLILVGLLPIIPNTMVVIVAMKATVSAWPWMRERLPHVRDQRDLQVSICPRLA